GSFTTILGLLSPLIAFVGVGGAVVLGLAAILYLVLKLTGAWEGFKSAVGGWLGEVVKTFSGLMDRFADGSLKVQDLLDELGRTISDWARKAWAYIDGWLVQPTVTAFTA